MRTNAFSGKYVRTAVAVWIILIFAVAHSAKAQLNVSVVVKPPASAVFSEYGDLSNKVIITIQNTVNRPVDHIILHGRLVKTSDEFLRTAENYVPPQFLSFNPLESKTIIIDPVQLRFLRKEVVQSSVPGLLPQILTSNLLPEGNWTLCVQAMSVNVDLQIFPVSNEACYPINITRANPPVITSPFNGQTLPSQQPNVVFAWTPPTGNTIGAQVVYDLYAVKVLPGQSPNDAINAAVAYKANNPLVKSNLSGNQYVTQPFDLKLDTGSTYAVQIVARDLNKKIAFQHDGRSEVAIFHYGKSTTGQGILQPVVAVKPTDQPLFTYPVTNVDLVPMSEVKGKLLYKFQKAVRGSAKSTKSDYTNAAATNIVQGKMGGGDLQYNKEVISQADTRPLANTKISLVLTYVFSGKIDNDSYSGEVLNEGSLYNTKHHFKDMDQVIATTTTGADGSFSFNFMNFQKTLGLINANLDLTTGGGEFKKHATGTLFKVYRIRVENKYYCSPDVNIKVGPWMGIDLGGLVSYVKTYNLKVKVTWTNAKFWDVFKGQGTSLSGVSTTLLRKAKPQHAPEDEGDVQSAVSTAKRAQGPNQEIQAVTDKNGYITFYDLIQHDPDNPGDRYYIKCKPDSKAGQFVFKEKEKSYYPLWDKDKTNFPYNAQGQYIPVSAGFKVPVTFGATITWNSELEIKTYTDSIWLQPTSPRIAGIVEAAKNVEAKSFANLKVVSINSYKNSKDPTKLFTVVKTNKLGRYELNNLDIETEGFTVGEVSTVVGPKRTIIVKPEGFQSGTYPAAPPLPPMLWGQQIVDADFSLDPDGWINGYVEDEEGNAVEADIDIDGFIKTSTQTEFYSAGTVPNSRGINQKRVIPAVRQAFRIAAPSGDNRKIYIQPFDIGFAVKDTVLAIKKGSNKQTALIKFVVQKSKKRIRFQVLENSTPGRLKLPGTVSKPIAGATVALDIPGKPITQTTDQQGFVSFIFESMAENFSFIITPSPASDYEKGTYSLSAVKNTTQMVNYSPAYLKKAATITGTVTLGADKKILSGATIYIETGNGNKLEATTNQAGTYTLKGVPLLSSAQKVWASKPGATPNIISQYKTITVKQTNTLDFNLETDNELLIEKVFGFDVEIKSKEKQTDGTWLLSGSLINLPSNENFSLKDSKQSIPFTGLKMKKSGEIKNGLPVGVPAETQFSTDLSSLKLTVHTSFGAVQTPASGDLLTVHAENNKGKIQGKIAIQKSSFQFSQDYIHFSQNQDYAMLLTDKPGSLSTNLTSIEASPAAKKKFGVAGLSGSALTYTLLGFKAKADNQKSFLENNDISLHTVLTIENIPSMNPSKLDIEAGPLVIHPNKFDPLENSSPLKFKLEKWEFTGTNWVLQQSTSGINIAEGVMKTGIVDVPLKNVRIKPGDLEIGDAQLTNMTLSGVAPLQIVAKTPVFGYNPSVGSDQQSHWELRIIGESGQPGVTISALPGMKPGEVMKFQKFSLISNGEQFINPGNQEQIITFYDVLKVKPLAFTGGDKYFDMACGIDLDIPQLEEMSGSIRFSKPAGQIQFELFPVNVSVHGPGGVDFFANLQYNDKPQQLTNGKFTAMGTLRDKEGIVLKAVLARTTSAAWVEVNPKNQFLALGSGKLADVEGRMDAVLNTEEWKNFSFSGKMEGFKGMQGDTKKTFTVYGSITANNERVSVKNIPTGFGNIGITYDIANSRFIGDLQLDKQIGAMYISGTANFVVDGGGWYFLAGGAVQTPGIGALSAGLMIGDYNTMPEETAKKLMQYAYDKNIPPSFKNKISGFFFTGMKELPVINIPNYSIDLGVISASFGAQAGLDARLWMGFDQAGNEYGIGAMVFAHAYLNGASITCTKFSADARAELGIKGVYQSANGMFSLKGCGSFTISGSIEQCVPTPCWDGICCEYCGGVGVSQGIKVDLTLDSGGNTDLSFGFGNCSGQATMTGNW